jgi:hypothetical protein
VAIRPADTLSIYPGDAPLGFFQQTMPIVPLHSPACGCLPCRQTLLAKDLVNTHWDQAFENRGSLPGAPSDTLHKPSYNLCFIPVHGLRLTAHLGKRLNQSLGFDPTTDFAGRCESLEFDKGDPIQLFIPPQLSLNRRLFHSEAHL